MKNAREILSENLLKLMKRNDIDQKQLAEKLKVSQSSVSQWIRGNKYPRIDKIEAMAEVFNVYKSELTSDKPKEFKSSTSHYNHYNTPISAGLPDLVEAVTHTEQIEIPDSIMGKHAGQKDIFITKVNGQSMNRIIPDGSLIAVKPIDLHQIKQGDIVVYSDNGDYSVKRFYKNDDQLIFRPDSNDNSFFDYITSTENPNLKIHGKVVVYIVELD